MNNDNTFWISFFIILSCVALSFFVNIYCYELHEILTASYAVSLLGGYVTASMLGFICGLVSKV